MTTGASDRQDLVEAARDAYVFLFPMLMGYRFLFGAFLVPGIPSHQVPLNTLGGKPRTLDHTFREVITPNADTPYSMAGLDLRADPLVLSVPAVTDRFYHFQLEDLWGQNVHYVGVRATGTGPGTYLLAGPGWDAETPAGVDATLRFETDVVFVIGRTQLLGPGDVETRGLPGGRNLRVGTSGRPFSRSRGVLCWPSSSSGTARGCWPDRTARHRR